MGKKTRTHKIRGIVIFLVIFLILAGGAGAYFYYGQHTATQKAKQETAHEAAKKAVDAVALRGDTELAVQYVEAVRANDAQAAQQVYMNKVNAAQDDNEKIKVLSDYVLLAYKNKQYDQQLAATLAIEKIRSNYLTLFDVARAYGDLGNKQKQLEYLDKAIASLDALPQDENTKNIRALYISTRGQVKGK